MPFRRTSIDSDQRTGFYSPKRSRVVGSRRIFEFDADALTYINAVEAADGEALEFNVKTAYNAFVVGCKSDGVWNAIKASCIMAGARTLSGALVPLVGVAPSGFNLASGEYSRASGLKGDGVSMYLSSNRNNNADSQNNQHLVVYHNSIASGVSAIAGNPDVIGTSQLIALPQPQTKSRNFTGTSHGGSALGIGLFGVSRSISSTYQWRATGGTVGGSVVQSSETPDSSSIFIFARNATSGFPTTSRLSFFSIGESLDLALLDNRVTVLMSGIQNAIP